MSYLSYQIRGGTRGGRDQFKWDDVRQMSHKDREQYLGQTVMIGFLDKGGKWRKKDWYAQQGLTEEEIEQKIKQEQQKIIGDDQKRIRIALGLEKQEKKTISETATEQEKMILLKQIREGMEGDKPQVNPWDDINENDEQRGIGFKHNDEQLQKVKANMDMSKFLNYDPTRLEAEGFSDNEQNKEKTKKDKKSKNEKRKDEKLQSASSERKESSGTKSKKIKKDSKDKSDKKSKKDKKHKKDKKKHKSDRSHKKRHDSSSRSSSEQRHKDKQKK